MEVAEYAAAGVGGVEEAVPDAEADVVVVVEVITDNALVRWFAMQNHS